LRERRYEDSPRYSLPEQGYQFHAGNDIEIVPFARRLGHGAARHRVFTLLAETLASFLIVFLYGLTRAGARDMPKRLRLLGLAELLAADRVIVSGGGYLYSVRRVLISSQDVCHKRTTPTVSLFG